MKLCSIPLRDLTLSPHNARKTTSGDIADLAANIRHCGLLQNLVVTEVDGRFEVIAGGRRLRALQLLSSQGLLPSRLQEIPVTLVANGEVVEASTAENTLREAMHPADQFKAFQAMLDAGKPLADVAAHFGVTDQVVQRRLKLANVAPEIFEEFRADRATLDQMIALAITDDHAAQRAVWEKASGSSHMRAPAQLRAALTPRQIRSSDHRVRLVGLDAYEAAGGPVLRDLFDDAGGGYVLDEALLDRLVAERAEQVAEQLRGEGWSFVRVDLSDDAVLFRYGCDASRPNHETRVLSEEDTQRLGVLNARCNELNEAIDALDDTYEPEDDHPLIIERDDIQEQINYLRQPLETWSDRQKEKAGCLVSIDNARIRIDRGLIPSRPAELKKVAESTGQPVPAKKPELAESMIRRLTAHRTIALQAALVQNADVALQAVAHALLVRILYRNESHTGESALNITGVLELNQLDKFQFDDVSNSAHYKHTCNALAELTTTLGVPARKSGFWPWLRQQNRDTVCALLAAAAAFTVNAVQGHPGQHAADLLAEALDLDMADYWRPTAATFYSVVPRAIGLEAVKDVAGAAQAERLATLKKDAFAGEAEKLTAKSGWLPKPLRRPGYKLGAGKDKAPTAPAAPTKPAKKPAAKKAIKKPVPTKKKAAPTRKGAKK